MRTWKMNDIKTFLIYALVFCFPILPKVLPILIFLLFIVSLIDYKHIRKPFKNYRSLTSFFTLFYILHLIGLLYSTNLKYGISDLEIKLSFLLIPLTWGNVNFDLKKIFQIFSISNAIAVLILLGFSYYHYKIELPDPITLSYPIGTNYYFSSYYSWIIHPSYFALYLCLSIAFVIELILYKNKILLNTILLTILISGVFLCDSLMGELVFYSILILFVVKLTILPWLSKHWKLCMGIFGILALVTSFLILPVLKVKVDRYYDGIPKNSVESIEVRAIVWKESMDLIKSNILLGVGTGDVKDKLVEKYELNGLTGASEKKLNAHNQFFQTTIAFGIPGILLLFLMLAFQFYKSFQYKDWLWFIFIWIIALNLLVESMLERQAGIIFFVLFSLLFNTKNKLTQANEE